MEGIERDLGDIAIWTAVILDHLSPLIRHHDTTDNV